MKYSGIIFDFNGTLFFDSDKHEDAWRIFSEKLRGYPISSEELQKFILGRTNRSILEYLLGKTLDDDTVFKLSEEKEQIYREKCMNDPVNLKLVSGAVELLDYLKEKHIPYTIATGSGKSNLLFYMKFLNLNRWFNFNKMVYDDGFLPGKPEPDIYLKAADKIGIPPEKCIVVEDSISGIEAAYKANIGKIVAIGPENKHDDLKNLKGVNYVISNFKDFDRNILQ